MARDILHNLSLKTVSYSFKSDLFPEGREDMSVTFQMGLLY